MTFDEYLRKTAANYLVYPNWRWGQALFSTLSDERPDLAELVTATSLDPFYVGPASPVISKFLLWVEANLK